MKKLIAVVAGTAAALAVAVPALAADWTLTGAASIEGDHVKLVSDYGNAVTTDDSSGIRFTVPAGLTFGAMSALGTDYNVTDDDCGGGSPRFQINVDMGGGVTKNVFVYLGPTPSFTGCTKNTWLSSGNLVGTGELRVDTSQVGGSFYDTWAGAVAKVGTKPVKGVDLVVDSGWFFAPPGDREQTVLVRNVTVNGKTYFTPAPPGPGNQANPAKLCSAQRALIGSDAFNELWGTNGNDRNAFGKCVSAMAKMQNGERTAAHGAIVGTSKQGMAKGLHGVVLGAYVAAHDGLSVTKADPPNGGKKAKKPRKRGKHS